MLFMFIPSAHVPDIVCQQIVGSADGTCYLVAHKYPTNNFVKLFNKDIH